VRRLVVSLLLVMVALTACHSDAPIVPSLLPVVVQGRPVLKVYNANDNVHLTCAPDASAPSELNAPTVTLTSEAGSKYRLGTAFFTEDQVTSASVEASADPSVWVVDLTLDADGTRGLEAATRDALRNDPAGLIATIVDCRVATAAVVQAVIDSGLVQLGGLTQGEAQHLAEQLNA
jgi:preprotein translocase subunit SecD